MRALLSLVALVLLVAVVLIVTGVWRPQFIGGALPTVAVEGGRAPEFKANLPRVSVEQKTVEVPTLEVRQPAGAATPGNAQ